MRRICVGVLMGGASSEREISLASGKMIAEHLPRDRYDVVMLDTLALMAENPRITAALRERARELIAHHASAERLEERDRELPSAFQEQIRQAAAATLPARDQEHRVHRARHAGARFPGGHLRCSGLLLRHLLCRG